MVGFEVIEQKFDLESKPELSEEDLLMILADRISQMLDSEAELLFSTLYRLDVYESKINQVIASDEDTALGLARLVIERQKQKIRTKQEYRDKGDQPDFIDI